MNLSTFRYTVGKVGLEYPANDEFIYPQFRGGAGQISFQASFGDAGDRTGCGRFLGV